MWSESAEEQYNEINTFKRCFACKLQQKNYTFFFAYTNIDACLVLLLRALFLFKKVNRQLILLSSNSTAMADQIKSVPVFNLYCFQVVTLNPASRSAMGGQDADQWDWWAREWRWVSWQTWGHTPGHSWEHDRGQGGASVRWGWPAGEVRQTHTSHLWALLLEITRKSDPHMTPGRGETLKSSHVVFQWNTHTTVLMTLHFHLHFCFKKTVPLKQ